MGSYDGAEICELVGLYTLSILSKRYGKENIGLVFIFIFIIYLFFEEERCLKEN